MSNLLGTNVAGKIVPFTTDDTYASHEDIYGQGGLMSVADLTARDTITAARRKQGMLVYVISENILYQLIGGITNGDWITKSLISFGIAGENLLANQPLYIKNDASLGIADNTTFLKSKVIGFALNNALISETCYYSKNVIIKDDWTAITGTEFLTINSVYFLSTAGLLTASPPVSGYNVKTGEAISTTMLQIDISSPYLI